MTCCLHQNKILAADIYYCMMHLLTLGVLVLLLLCVFTYVMRETYIDENGAALVCYWTPQAPTMAVPIPRDPYATRAKDGPRSSVYDAPPPPPPPTPSAQQPRKRRERATFAPLAVSLTTSPAVSRITITEAPAQIVTVAPTTAPLVSAAAATALTGTPIPLA